MPVLAKDDRLLPWLVDLGKRDLPSPQALAQPEHHFANHLMRVVHPSHVGRERQQKGARIVTLARVHPGRSAQPTCYVSCRVADRLSVKTVPAERTVGAMQPHP